jgi:hypothetical protein
MPSTSSHDFDSPDQRIDALCTRLGSDDAAGATDFANRNGSSDESRPCPARIAAPEYPEHIGLDEIADGIWAVYFYDYLLGHLNEREGHVQGVHVRTKTSR